MILMLNMDLVQLYSCEENRSSYKIDQHRDWMFQKDIGNKSDGANANIITYKVGAVWCEYMDGIKDQQHML